MNESERVHAHAQSRDIDQAIHAAPHAIVNSQRIELGLGRETLVIVLALTLVIGACGVIMGLNLSRQQTLEDAFLKLDRQSRMTELKLDDWTVVAHRAGLALPSDYTRGPQGNLDTESFNVPQQKAKGK
jgi:hypothetical protein